MPYIEQLTSLLAARCRDFYGLLSE